MGNFNLKQWQKDAEYLTYIENACFYIFQLYMKQINKKISFDDFYNKYIESQLDKLQIDYEQFKNIYTNRYKRSLQYTCNFLSFIKSRDQQQYKSIKQQIYKHAEQQFKDTENLKQFVSKDNFHQLSWLITNYDEDKESIERKVFIKPSIEEINTYCRERNNGINAEAFYDFYESKN